MKSKLDNAHKTLSLRTGTEQDPIRVVMTKDEEEEKKCRTEDHPSSTQTPLIT